MHRKAVLFAACLGLLAGSACTPTTGYQGFQPIDQRPAEVKVGEDTRNTVLAKLGSPTVTSTFDKDVWFYMSQTRNQTSFYRPKVIKRDVVAISFDHITEQVASVHTFTLQDGRVIAYDRRETPTRGREMTVLEQLIGSIGRGSVLPPDQDITPGSHPGDTH
ncbi:MAG: outer membrane protein assembly factor BamE [Caulobacteraceae bacterium]|nr:outer membrane protein assembly factor BamE [Caulobacteraceae bacterium]